jgi:ketosteroid isomerase-like protein
MSEPRNTQIVREAYAAFGRGDINAIVSLLTDDVEWEGVKGTEGVLPQAGRRRGKAAITEFFGQVDSTTQFDTFEPLEFVAQADTVVCIGRYSGKAKTTGRSIAADWVMVFSFRGDKIARFREFTDSAQLVKAFGQVAAA